MEISQLYHNTRPEGELLPQEAAAFDALERLGIDHDRVSSEPADNMEKCAAVSAVLGMPICKNLFLRDAKGKQHYLVSVPDERHVDLKWLSAALGTSKLSFASAERLEKYLKVPQGSVSPLALLNDESESVIFAADETLSALPAVGVHPNDNTATVFLSFADLHSLIEEHGNGVLLLRFPEEG